jgi:hypothetical protein
VRRATRDEQGAALIFAIGFVVVIGALAATLYTPLNTGFSNRNALDDARNREYGADAGIQYAIATVRQTMPADNGVFSGAGFDPCGPYAYPPGGGSLNGFQFSVKCEPSSSTSIGGFVERDVVFTAYCVSGPNCDSTAPIIRAQVNYEAVGTGDSYQVSHTYIRSWSVNG